METPDPFNDTPGASKHVILTPHDIPRILRVTGFITSKRWDDFAGIERHIPDAVRCLASEMVERPEADPENPKFEVKRMRESCTIKWCPGWWFQIFFIFIPTWGNI